MLQTALSIVLMAHAIACGSALPPNAPASSLRPVIVEPESANVKGALTVDDRVLCQLPCTIRLRAETQVVIELTEPWNERIELPTTIPERPTNVPVRIVVHPTRGHVTAGRSLFIGGIVWSVASAVIGGVAYAALSSHSADDDTRLSVVPLVGLVGFGLIFVALGAGILATTEQGHADVATAKPATAGGHITPRGFEVLF